MMKITDGIFWAIKGLRNEYSQMDVMEFAEVLKEKGITRDKLSKTTLYYLLPANDPEEYRAQARNAKQAARQKRKALEEKNKADVQEEECKEQSCEVIGDDENEIENHDALLDELRHANHLLDAMYIEQKHTSSLIQQLIDLWRR